MLTLIGLITAALPAVLSAGLPGLRLKAAARDMVDVLRDAHAQALKTHKELVLTVDTESGRYGIISTTEPTAIPAGAALRFRDIPYAEARGPIAHIRFFPDGSSTGGSIGLVEKGQQYWIGVDWLTGRASILD